MEEEELIILPQVHRKRNLNRKYRSRPFVKAGPAFSRRLLTVSVHVSTLYLEICRIGGLQMRKLERVKYTVPFSIISTVGIGMDWKMN